MVRFLVKALFGVIFLYGLSLVHAQDLVSLPLFKRELLSLSLFTDPMIPIKLNEI